MSHHRYLCRLCLPHQTGKYDFGESPELLFKPCAFADDADAADLCFLGEGGRSYSFDPVVRLGTTAAVGGSMTGTTAAVGGSMTGTTATVGGSCSMTGTTAAVGGSMTGTAAAVGGSCSMTGTTAAVGGSMTGTQLLSVDL